MKWGVGGFKAQNKDQTEGMLCAVNMVKLILCLKTGAKMLLHLPENRGEEASHAASEGMGSRLIYLLHVAGEGHCQHGERIKAEV